MDWVAVKAFIDDHQAVFQVTLGSLTFVLAVVGFLFSVPRIRKEILRLRDEQKRAAAAVVRIDELRNLSEQGQQGIWSRSVNYDEVKYNEKLQGSIPIILLANLKGGVGKTTIAANLAAALASSAGLEADESRPENTKRVLAIDLDYQGSLSSLFLGHNEIDDPREIDDLRTKAIGLLGGDRNAAWAKEAAQPLKDPYSNLRYLPTDSEMADLENRLTLRWLIGETGKDVRFNLMEVLSHADIQHHFDYVILDTAPRLTLSFINGLCAATHLIVPTGLDNLAAQSAGNFIIQYKFLKPRICPQLELIGVVPSMTYNQGPANYIQREQPVVARLQGLVRGEFGSSAFLLENCNIHRAAHIRNAAGEKLAYFESDESRTIFTTLAKEVIERTRR